MHWTTTRVGTPAGTVAVRSAGAGPRVLLLHGIPGSGGVWGGVASRLVARGQSVLVPDLLGFGGSDRPTALEALWIDAQATALATVLEQSGEAPMLVAGHDYGAPVAVTLARRRPDLVRGLVLAAGNLLTDTPIPPPLRAVLLPVAGPLLARLVFSALSLRLMLWAGSGRPRPRLNRAAYLGDRAQVRAIGTLFQGALAGLATRYAPVEAALPVLGRPSVVVWGDRDPFFPLEEGQRVARAAGADLIVAPGAGHFLPAERPDVFIDAVDRLARRGESEKPD